ncbi:DUF924 family protein [Ottowia thiooxydans]|uniref:DUF924 family protein n=1 Tax=Ottowia thiooxydans TaxID=219182 RepID=UPI0004281AF1|nr:DUF924 family protein [Ottowia thiooxydans]
MTNSPSALSTASDVLAFWFGTAAPTDAASLQIQSQWFTKSDAFDAQIRTRFGATIEAAVKGELDSWASEPWGWLALVIVLDQFTRNVYRGQPASFSGDSSALRWSDRGLAEGWDRTLPLMVRPFTYLPLEHSEDLARQNQSVAVFEQLVADAESANAPSPVLATLKANLDYAERHRDVIRRFGRFPHRNAFIGRASTPAEVEYLAQPGAGF